MTEIEPDTVLIARIVERSRAWIAAQERWAYSPLLVPRASPEESAQAEADWREAGRRGLRKRIKAAEED